MTVDAGQQAFSLIGQLVAAGGGGAIVAFAVFRFLGKSWIENQLAKDLELAKSEIGLLSARRLKLHDREYVVFPEVWAKLNCAVDSLGGAIVSFMELPDFSRMSDQELSDWLDRSDLSSDEKEYFLKQSDKGRGYSKIVEWRRLMEARRDFLEFHTALRSNRIFISPAIKEKLDQIDNLMHSAWVHKKLDWEGHSRGADENFLLGALRRYDKEIKPLVLEIEGLVQAKLFPEEVKKSAP